MERGKNVVPESVHSNPVSFQNPLFSVSRGKGGGGGMIFLKKQKKPLF